MQVEEFKQSYLDPIVNDQQIFTPAGDSAIANSNIQSSNYSPNTASGYQLGINGDATFNNITAKGRLTVTSGGVVGGFDIGADYLRDTGNSFGLASTVTGANDVRFWAGDTFANRAIAPLRFYEDGTGVIGGWTVGLTSLSATGISLDAGNKKITLGSNDIVLDATNKLINIGSSAEIAIDGANKKIVSSNYQAGTSGFYIDSNKIEAENLISRGTMRGSTFAYDVISAIGGQLMVTNSDTLASDMTAQDSSTLTIKGDTTLAVNDMLLIRGVATSGIQEEWLRVTSITSAPTYSVTRDIKGDFASNNNPAWKAGTPVVVQGSSDGASTYSGGWLRLIGAGTNAPYYSVFARNGVAYNAYTEAIRMGNLNGFLDYASDLYGIAIGSSTNYLKYDSTNSLRIAGDVQILKSLTAGESLTVTTPMPVYISTADGKVYQCDDTNAAKLGYTGMILSNATINTSIGVQFSDVVSNYSGLKVGFTYYLKKGAGSYVDTTNKQTATITGDNYCYPYSSGYGVIGQTFTTGTVFNVLKSVDLFLKRNSFTNTLTLKMRLFTAADKTTVLATSTNTLTYNNISSSTYTSYNFTFNDYLLSPSTQYFLELSFNENDDSSNYYVLWGSHSGSGGEDLWYKSGGTWTNSSNYGQNYTVNLMEKYASGDIAITPGVNSVKVGRAVSTSKLLLYQLAI